MFMEPNSTTGAERLSLNLIPSRQSRLPSRSPTRTPALANRRRAMRGRKLFRPPHYSATPASSTPRVATLSIYGKNCSGLAAPAHLNTLLSLSSSSSRTTMFEIWQQDLGAKAKLFGRYVVPRSGRDWHGVRACGIVQARSPPDCPRPAAGPASRAGLRERRDGRQDARPPHRLRRPMLEGRALRPLLLR